MFDWDDLRIFIAAARAQSFSGAAMKLHLDAATVGRRVAGLESALKSTLLVRTRNGVQLTATGTQLLRVAETAEAAMGGVERAARPDAVGGTVRISVAEGFGVKLLAPSLPSFAAAHPSIRIELAANAGFLSASRREVDMAITLGAPQAQKLMVESLTRYQLALYSSEAYLRRHGTPKAIDDLRHYDFIGYVDDLIYAGELRYLDEILPGLSPVLASSSIQAQRQMIEYGGGIGVLPCFLADGLVRVLPQAVLLERRFWLCTLPEVHNTARMRAVTRWLREHVFDHAAKLAPY
jgi:DNA-binding transcriptional LysR family regulator